MHVTTHAEASSGYWYPEHGVPSSVDVLNLLRRYRAAEGAMRARTCSSMGMGETDLLALRTLLQAQRRGEVMRQRDLAAALDLASPPHRGQLVARDAQAQGLCRRELAVLTRRGAP